MSSLQPNHDRLSQEVRRLHGADAVVSASERLEAESLHLPREARVSAISLRTLRRALKGTTRVRIDFFETFSRISGVPVNELVLPEPGGFLKADKYHAVLTNLVTADRSVKSDLWVSVGTADFVAAWINRIPPENVQIDRLFLVHLSDEEIKKLDSMQRLEPRFRERLHLNLAAIQNCGLVQCLGIEVVLKSWPGMSPFHGYHFDNSILFGEWAELNGKLHVNTELYYGTNLTSGQRRSEMLHAFLSLK